MGERPRARRLGPKDRFYCDVLRCRLTVKTCVERQDARRKMPSTGELRPAYIPCGLGTCQQGKTIRARAEAPVQLQVISRVGNPGGPPRRRAATDGRFVPDSERTARPPKVPRAKLSTDEWLGFIGEHRLGDVLREPQRWRATAIETADEPLVDTAGQRAGACLIAAADEAVRAGIDRRMFLRLATHLFNALLEQQPAPAPEAA